MTLEAQARRAWQRWGQDSRFSQCGVCGLLRDEYGQRIVVRKRGRSRWLCLDCWDRGQR